MIKLDLDTVDVDLAWNERSAGLGVVPSVVVLNDWVSPNPKPQALSNLADRVLLQRGQTARSLSRRKMRSSAT